MVKCPECYRENPQDSKYCNKCGTILLGKIEEYQANDDLVMVLKPKYITKITVLRLLPVILLSGFLLAMFPVLIVLTIESIGDIWFPTEVMILTLLFSFLIFGITIFLPAYVQKKTYQNIVYRIYQDRVDFDKGSFTVEENTIRFKDVKEVILRQGYLQKKVGLGTIFLSAITFTKPTSKTLVDIEDPEKVCEKIKRLVSSTSK